MTADRKTIVGAIVGLIVLVVITVPVIISVFGSESDGIRIVRIPTDAVVRIDGNVVGDIVTLETNQEYVITGERDGWVAYEETVILHEFSKNILIVLEPDSEDAHRWRELNKDLYRGLEAASGEESVADGMAMRLRYPIIDFLTYNHENKYVITYGHGYPNENIDGFFLLIRAPVGLRNTAVKRIYDMGFDPADYLIVFKDFLGDERP
jgi:hypothetical protein